MSVEIEGIVPNPFSEQREVVEIPNIDAKSLLERKAFGYRGRIRLIHIMSDTITEQPLKQAPKQETDKSYCPACGPVPASSTSRYCGRHLQDLFQRAQSLKKDAQETGDPMKMFPALKKTSTDIPSPTISEVDKEEAA
jgi:hypothetical protein